MTIAIGSEQGSYAGQIFLDEHDGQGTSVILTFLGTDSGIVRAQGMKDGLTRARRW